MNRLLPSLAASYQNKAKQNLQDVNVTAQCDGWTGLNNNHLIAFMINADCSPDRKILTVRVHDASKERKTAENLLKLMLDVISELEQEWKVKLVAFTSDASGESRKARKLLSLQRPDIVTPDCYAHQSATELIAWIRSKSFLIALIHETQKSSGQCIITPLRAVLTQWTSHYIAFDCLLDLRPTLVFILVTGDAASKQKARGMLSLIEDTNFWLAIARMKSHLEPLAIAANITQAAFCRLDQVLLTFAYLYMHFDGLQEQVDREIRAAVCSSIEACWAKSDQEVFIAAVLLNPFVVNPFNIRLEWLNRAGLLNIFARLFKRFFGHDILTQMLQNINDFFADRGVFQGAPAFRQVLLDQAQEQKRSPDPAEFWGGLPLVQLAIPSCERLFSIFGNTLTKLRNKLGSKTLTMLAGLKMHIRDEHLAKEESKRLKRHFGQVRQEHNQSPTPAATSATAGASDGTGSIGRTSGNDDREEEDEFREITNTMGFMLDDDRDIDFNLQFPSRLQIPIRDLFDFQSTAWVETHNRRAMQSLEEEMEFYELVDLDGEGSQGGIDVAIDEALAAII
ncbi:ribonuclease H-like domain-containing protein [Lentinula raphanica]|nr:ribonuclease H-like domain-containing protein [Lentinula raphanica]